MTIIHTTGTKENDLHTYTLHHDLFDGPFVVDTGMSERGIRAMMSGHVAKTFDVMIPMDEWDVTCEDAPG